MASSVSHGSTLKRLLRYAWPHRGLLGLSFSCMALLGLTTGAYAYLMGPALRFLLSGGTEGLGPLAKLFPVTGQLNRERLLWGFPLAIVGLGLVKGVSYLGQFYWMGWFGQRVGADLRRQVFAKLTRLSPARMSQHRSGDLLTRFSLDVAQIELAATYSVGSYVRDSLQIAILVVVALSVNWKFALSAFAALPLAILPASRLTRSVLKRMREGQAQLGNLASHLQEGLGGLKTIQAFNAEEAELARFDSYARRHLHAMVRAGWARGAVPGVMEVLAALAIAAVLGYAAQSHSIAPEALISVLASLILIYQPAKDLGRVSQFALSAAVAGERIFALLDDPEGSQDRRTARPAPLLRRSIRLENVGYSYGERVALAGVSLEIPLGQLTALVGPSGGGKSTVTSLLLRFDRPSAGQILWDDVDADEYDLESVRQRFSLVTQEALLFSASVAENIHYGRLGASKDEVIEAARLAQAHEFIRRLPNGYDTPLGERGVVLSGGQKQRICLARALLAGAQVMVLDEATSNLDPQSEEEVRAALRQVLVSRTAVIVAHRLSTVMDAQNIYVLDGGKVVESGTHASLVAAQGLYARLWTLQEEGQRQGAA